MNSERKQLVYDACVLDFGPGFLALLWLLAPWSLETFGDLICTLAAILDPTALECHKYKAFRRTCDGSVTAHSDYAILLWIHVLMAS